MFCLSLLLASLFAAPVHSSVQERLWVYAINGGHSVSTGQPATAINGQPAALFFDTGVGAPLVLTNDFVKRIGLPMAYDVPEHETDPIPGRPEVGYTVPCVLTFLGVKAQLDTVPVFEMPPNVPRGTEVFEGMVGWPTMRESLWSFDLSVGLFNQILAVPPAALKWQQYEIWDEDNTLSFVLPSDPRGVERVIVDTGNPSGIELPPDQWKAWVAAHPDAPMTIFMDYLPGQKVRCSYETFAKTFPLGTLVLHDVAVAQADPSYYQVQAEPGEKVVAIGLAAFARMEVVLDPGNALAYVRTSRHPALPYLHNRIGAAFYPATDDSPDLVARVVPRTPADKAGIRTGDILVQVNHQSTASWRSDGVLLKRIGGRVPAGTKLVFTVKRGEQVLDFPVTARDIL